jgi:hypothetical protein
MSGQSVGSMILNDLIATAEPVVETVYGTLIGSWPGQTFVFLYVVIVGYMVLMGKAGDKSKEWALSAFLLLVIGGISSNYVTFNEWIAGPIWDAAQGSGGMAATGGSSSSPGGISGILDASGETFGKIMSIVDRVDIPGNPITNAWLYLKVGGVFLILSLLAGAQYVAMVALLCIAVFSLLMMFMVAGPCLWFASFKETRFITWAWLRATLNYALWIFFLGAVSGIANKYLEVVANILVLWDLERDGVFTRDIGANLLLTSLSIYMLLKASDWAAALTGGTSTNTGVIGALGGMAGGALGGAMNILGGAAGSAARWGAGAAINHTGAGQAAYRAYSAIRGIGQVKN